MGYRNICLFSRGFNSCFTGNRHYRDNPWIFQKGHGGISYRLNLSTRTRHAILPGYFFDCQTSLATFKINDMKFTISAQMTCNATSPATAILNIHALRTQHQAVINETFSVGPYLKIEELSLELGENRLVRFEVENPGTYNISYNATIDNFCEPKDFLEAKNLQISKLDTTVIPYLYPSRYCQSDKIFRLASSQFGSIANPFEKVNTLTNWIYDNVQYLSGSTDSHTSAFDTITERAGVCRDFAHLGIALCRALTIPARYFTGYAYQLQPPDFHACFEAFIEDRWVLFDATKLVPLNGLVKIASGRDAADTAVANLFGNITFSMMKVDCTLAEQDFKPFYYEQNQFTGLSYI
jgi:hypothetical protein